MKLTHVDAKGRPRMVDVGGKVETRRTAVACGEVRLDRKTLKLIAASALPKGEVLNTARLAGIQAAKRASEWIPLCHPLRLTHIDVTVVPVPDDGLVRVTATVKAIDRTGVEMEALTAVAAACLTVYDMCKAADKRMVVGGIHLVSKEGERVARSSGEAGTVVSVNISRTKGVRKAAVPTCLIVPGLGFERDAHAGDGHRQVSLLALESIQKMRDVGLEVGPGDFAENITTSGIELVSLPIGTVFRVGAAARLAVSQIGKVCHDRCAIFEQAGDCVMPREGIFARVLAGGPVAPGDRIEVESVPDDKEKAMLKGTRFAVLTISDRSSRGERADASGPLLASIIRENGGEVVRSAVLPDDRTAIRAELEAVADSESADVILTTGGTGFAPRDVTPEATRDVLDKEAPGLAEAMRAESLKKTGTAMLSRAVAGIRKSTLIINLPGSPKAARENFEVVLPALAHAVELLRGRVGDCGKP